jgi:hypothetical protein
MTSHRSQITVSCAKLSWSPTVGGWWTKMSGASIWLTVRKNDMLNSSMATIVLNSTWYRLMPELSRRTQSSPSWGRKDSALSAMNTLRYASDIFPRTPWLRGLTLLASPALLVRSLRVDYKGEKIYLGEAHYIYLGHRSESCYLVMVEVRLLPYTPSESHAPIIQRCNFGAVCAADTVHTTASDLASQASSTVGESPVCFIPVPKPAHKSMSIDLNRKPPT